MVLARLDTSHKVQGLKAIVLMASIGQRLETQDREDFWRSVGAGAIVRLETSTNSRSLEPALLRW